MVLNDISIQTHTYSTYNTYILFMHIYAYTENAIGILCHVMIKLQQVAVVSLDCSKANNYDECLTWNMALQ